MSAPLLSMQGISKRFGATQALSDVSIDVHAGQVLALIGENGAGKSTLMKVLSGAYRPDSGSMQMSGQPFAPSGPHAARTAGVAMIYQELTLAPDLSVEDNVMLGQERHRWGVLQRSEQRARLHDALALLGHPQLRPETPVWQLSIAAQQLVEIARALVFDAQVIVFDEPTSSLTQADVEHLFQVVDKLVQQGRGIVYISHFLEEVRRVCDRYTVLRDGHVAGHGDLAGATEEEIVALMVGRSVDELFPTVPHEPGEAILTVDALTGPERPTDVSFELRRGEILGIAGLVGSGRTELLRCLFGLDRSQSGTVRREQDIAASPRARMDAGLALVSEDRKGEGLAQIRSICDNLTYSRLSPYARAGMLNLQARNRAAREWMTRMQVKAESPDQPVYQLSGGNQQKVAIGRVLHQEAEILLLDEPTRGIDVGTKAEIYRLMGELAAQGKAVVFVSSYFEELLAICDRIGVMSRGRLRDLRPTSEWDEASLLQVAIELEPNAS